MLLLQEIFRAGQEVASATEKTLPDILNRLLGHLLGWPFRVTSGCAADRSGNETASFGSVIYAAPAGDRTPETNAIPADAVAAVIDTYENLDLENFHAAYERIAQAKTLKKSPAPDLKEFPITTITLGIIFARRSALPLDALGEELDRLNAKTPSRGWADMVVVATVGVLNYAVQFPGEGLSGDFLPAGEGAVAAFTPPMYIVIVMRPTGAYALNQMLALLLGHLAIFSSGAKLPHSTHLLKEVQEQAVTISGYQYNLSGDLVGVPRQFYNDRYLPPLPMRIEDQRGDLLCTLQFLPWQDGGTVLLRGKLPLEGLLLFLGNDILRRGGIVKRPDAQISYVLPITQTHFNQMLARIQQQSNMIVRNDQTRWIIQKFADEGSQSPFWARLLIGIMHLRDAVFLDPSGRDGFDKSYEFIIASLINARRASDKIVQLWMEHARKVGLGEVVRLEGRAIHIGESIDMELRKEVETFLNVAVRAFKQGMQNLARELQIDIGFLFQKQTNFDTGIATLETVDSLLAEYLRKTRTWSDRLLESRIAIEHKGWMLPRVMYSEVGTGIKADEPLISGQPVSEFVRFIFDRLSCFVEEFTAHCLQKRMPKGFTITEIPLARRLPEEPERFGITLASGGLPAWQILYHNSSFEET